MIALLIAGLLQPDWAGWQQFDHRPNGFGDTAFLFDGSSRRQSGNFATAWVTYDFHYSGRNPTTHVELWEIDCLQRRSRARSGFVLDGNAPASVWRRARRFRAIAGDSLRPPWPSAFAIPDQAAPNPAWAAREAALDGAPDGADAPALLERAAAADQLEDEDDPGQHQQRVDQPAADMGDEADQPQHDEDGDDGPEHGEPPFKP